MVKTAKKLQTKGDKRTISQNKPMVNKLNLCQESPLSNNKIIEAFLECAWCIDCLAEGRKTAATHAEKILKDQKTASWNLQGKCDNHTKRPLIGKGKARGFRHIIEQIAEKTGFIKCKQHQH
jgi:hypothetical protein